MTTLNPEKTLDFIDRQWKESILTTMQEYIRIPNKSPAFDPLWQKNGFMEKACALIMSWCNEHAARNMQMEIIRLENRTPLLLLDIPGQADQTILLYGHLDKQPEMTGWDDGLDPWQPVLRDDKLYGRGAADDGYAIFAALTAISALQEQNLPHARCLILIECCEESGSLDLPFYIDALAPRIKTPDLIICLDSGCGNYEQLWVTTSLRGLVSGILNIDVLTQGVHSGFGSGIVPSVFRVLEQLLKRIENPNNGDINLSALQVTVPKDRLHQMEKTAQVLGDQIVADIPFIKGVQADSNDPKALLLRRTWQPALSLVGFDGIPATVNAGNVTLPRIAVKLSMRLPPLCHAATAAAALKTALEENPPYHAKVSFNVGDFAEGWNAPAESAWLKKASDAASRHYFGKEVLYMGEGGSIPFMGMLGKKFPQAQFLITGVLGPKSNAHGPNEFLHVPTFKKVTACIAEVIAHHFAKAPAKVD